MTLTKAGIAEELYEEHGLNRRESMECVDLLFEEIRLALESGHQVKLPGFGNFEVREKSERPGCNPKTKVSISISARRVVIFRPGKKLKARIETAIQSDDRRQIADDPE